MCELTNSVYLELLTSAAHRGTIVGSDLVKKFDIPKDQVTPILDNISKFCVSEGIPVLTCLVVQANTGMPSLTFFSKYTPLQGKPSYSAKLQAWHKLIKEVYKNAERYPTSPSCC